LFRLSPIKLAFMPSTCWLSRAGAVVAFPSVVHVLRNRLFDHRPNNCNSKIGRLQICASHPWSCYCTFVYLESYPRLFAPGSFRLTPGSLLLNHLFETFCGEVFKCASFFRHIRARWSKVGPSTCLLCHLTKLWARACRPSFWRRAVRFLLAWLPCFVTNTKQDIYSKSRADYVILRNSAHPLST
jgi:hypothetical protein